MLLTAQARGVYPIAPTPFFDDGRIDTESIDRLTDFYGRIGSTGITVLGQLGEAAPRAASQPVAVPATSTAAHSSAKRPHGTDRSMVQ